MMQNGKWRLFIIIPTLFITLALLYNLPPVKSRLVWGVDELRARVKYALSPPEQVVFLPQEQSGVTGTSQAPTPVPSLTPTLPPVGLTATLTPSPKPTLYPTSIPGRIQLSGFRHEYQNRNNCGPATLSMALSYWGWKGDQYDIASVTKPNPRDKTSCQ